ncbi:hypothetical protein COCON_G00159580 [Conger conger]|uniref:Uncharacterized protein n=1 Tax=Conger conger TaxID=82655 RepID=A0A9Q1HV97_CONCO|nr:hypothetical protein COCON_G00159580 [Conger conger]
MRHEPYSASPPRDVNSQQRTLHERTDTAFMAAFSTHQVSGHAQEDTSHRAPPTGEEDQTSAGFTAHYYFWYALSLSNSYRE